MVRGDIVKVGSLVEQVAPVWQLPDEDYHGKLGVIVEWTCHGDSGPLASAWVRWCGSSDWDCCFAEDLKVIS